MLQPESVNQLAEKWFGNIPAGEKYNRHLPVEPKQTEARKLEIKADVPLDALYKCWHMGARLDKDYYTADLITEVLGRWRFFQAVPGIGKRKKIIQQY